MSSTISTSSTSSSDYQDEFHAGVTACLRSWSALRTAVESGWGGGRNSESSLAKAEDLRTNIYQCFPILPEDLADNLAIYMEEEFSVVLEDGSDQQIAEMLCRLYETCRAGDLSLVRQVVESANRVVASSAECPVQIQSTEHDDDDDDDDDDDEEMDGTTNADAAAPSLETMPSAGSAREYASQYLFGAPARAKVFVPNGPVRQLGEAVPAAETEHVLDDDGFAPVKSRRRAAR